MIAKSIPVTLFKVENKKGIAKITGNAYDFYVMTVIDENADKFKLNLSEELVSSQGLASLTAPELHNVDVLIDVRFSPKGFEIQGTVLEFEIVEKE